MNGWIISLFFVWSIGTIAAIVIVKVSTLNSKIQELHKAIGKQVKTRNAMDLQRDRWMVKTLDELRDERGDGTE